MEDLNKQLILRRLLNEFAKKLAETMTFNQIAKIFFECGVIDNPERPYGVYQGSKAQYALEKLLASQNKNGFPEMLSAIQFDLCYSAGGPTVDDRTTRPLMKLLGYRTQTQSIAAEDDFDPSLISPSQLPKIGREKEVHQRISVDHLPSNLIVLISELNDNLDRNNFNASALLIRKILTFSCFIALDKVGKGGYIENKELHESLFIVQKELKISDKIMAKVKSAKWIGDSASHSYKIKINESDIEVASTGLRIFLEEIF